MTAAKHEALLLHMHHVASPSMKLLLNKNATASGEGVVLLG
jgi:hypothetical protein